MLRLSLHTARYGQQGRVRSPLTIAARCESRYAKANRGGFVRLSPSLRADARG